MESSDFTQMLELAQQGDAHAENELFQAIEHELRSIACRLARGRTSNGTSLVNEAYVYLFERAKIKKTIDLKNRRYFFVAIADRMRKILLDREKKRRPGPWDPVLGRRAGGFSVRDFLGLRAASRGSAGVSSK